MNYLRTIICTILTALILSSTIAQAGGGHNTRACKIEPDLPFCD